VAQLSTASNPGVIQRFTPRPELLPFVDLIWQYRGLVQAHRLERVLPTGHMGMIINLAEDRTRKYDAGDPSRVETQSGSILVGAHSGPIVIDTTEQLAVVGVSFTPGGAAPVLGVPATEARDLQISVEGLWGRAAGELRERLVNAEPGDRCRLIEKWLAQRILGSPPTHPAVAYALKEFSGIPHTRSIADVSDKVGFSLRRFIEIFDNEVGLTPKLYCRIRRFQYAIKLAHESDEVDWADLAALAGYYDQSHMIRDFQKFCGMSPSAYLKQRGPHLNHVPITS
jgi:AraC-like DNA-binding protein